MKRIHPLIPAALLTTLVAPLAHADNLSIILRDDLFTTGILDGRFVAQPDIFGIGGRTYPITGPGESDNQFKSDYLSVQFPGAVNSFNSGTLNLTPNTGSGHIAANYSFIYTQGGEGVADSYTLTYNVTASSLSATETDPFGFYGSGIHADAHVSISVGYDITQLSSLAPQVTLTAPAAGTVAMGQGTERYSARIQEGSLFFGRLGNVVAGVGFGDAPLTVTLQENKDYFVEYDYSLDVPFGVDPTVSFTVTGMAGGVAPVPEPAAMAAVGGAALLGWALLRRRNG